MYGLWKWYSWSPCKRSILQIKSKIVVTLSISHQPLAELFLTPKVNCHCGYPYTSATPTLCCLLKGKSKIKGWIRRCRTKDRQKNSNGRWPSITCSTYLFCSLLLCSQSLHTIIAWSQTKAFEYLINKNHKGRRFCQELQMNLLFLQLQLSSNPESSLHLLLFFPFWSVRNNFWTDQLSHLRSWLSFHGYGGPESWAYDTLHGPFVPDCSCH